MKITLAEFDAFQKAMPDNDWYFDGDEQFVNDDFWEGVYDPQKIIDVNEGDITLCYQGDKDLSFDEQYKDFLKEFEKWKIGKDTEILVLEVPKGMSPEIKKLVSEYLKEKK
jgi:hypothetical protein